MQLGRLNNVKRKFRAPRNLNPTLNPELIDHSAVINFIKHQEELITILEQAENVNLKKVKVPISISKIVRLRLGDALMFVIYHNERHIQQVKNILRSEEHTSELQSRPHLVCRLLLEKKKNKKKH